MTRIFGGVENAKGKTISGAPYRRFTSHASSDRRAGPGSMLDKKERAFPNTFAFFMR
jgi:hypothetical protein